VVVAATMVVVYSLSRWRRLMLIAEVRFTRVGEGWGEGKVFARSSHGVPSP
jgi:hypothetical protein